MESARPGPRSLERWFASGEMSSGRARARPRHARPSRATTPARGSPPGYRGVHVRRAWQRGCQGMRVRVRRGGDSRTRPPHPRRRRRRCSLRELVVCDDRPPLMRGEQYRHATRADEQHTATREQRHPTSARRIFRASSRRPSYAVRRVETRRVDEGRATCGTPLTGALAHAKSRAWEGRVRPSHPRRSPPTCPFRQAPGQARTMLAQHVRRDRSPTGSGMRRPRPSPARPCRSRPPGPKPREGRRTRFPRSFPWGGGGMPWLRIRSQGATEGRHQARTRSQGIPPPP